MMSARMLLMLVFGGLSSQLVVAQAPPSGPCPPGAVPIPGQGRCGSPAEASAINSRGAGNSAPAYTEIWEDRYGAVAIDPKTGKQGAAENEKSKRLARREAVKYCGAASCIVMINVRNSCQASAWGGGSNFYEGGEDKSSAEDSVLRKCSEKNNNCRITYSGCSLPVRVK